MLNNERVPLQDQFYQAQIYHFIRQLHFVGRAQELRWFHDQVEDRDSAIFSAQDLCELLDRVREAFNGIPEE